MLSIAHIKMDDDDVISLISTSRLRKSESSSHCVTTPLPSILNFFLMKSNFTPSFQSVLNPHYLISEVIVRISWLVLLHLDLLRKLCNTHCTLILTVPPEGGLLLAHITYPPWIYLLIAPRTWPQYLCVHFTCHLTLCAFYTFFLNNLVSPWLSKVPDYIERHLRLLKIKVLFVCLGVLVWNQGLVHAQQVLYHWAVPKLKYILT